MLSINGHSFIDGGLDKDLYKMNAKPVLVNKHSTEINPENTAISAAIQALNTTTDKMDFYTA